MAALTAVPLVIDVTVEGMVHAPETREVMAAGGQFSTSVMSIRNCSSATCRIPRSSRRSSAAAMLRRTKIMHVTSDAGTDLTIDVDGAAVKRRLGYTRCAGVAVALAGGLVACYPKSGAVNGRVVMDRGDINLTFKRYLKSPVELIYEKDYALEIKGDGLDADLMRRSRGMGG